MKRLEVLVATTIRRLIDVANSKSVTKEDIVDIKKIGDEYILIYYGDEKN